MRSYKVFGIRDGGAETYVDTAYSAEDGKHIHQLMLVQGYFDEMIVRDCLGGVAMRKDLRREIELAVDS